MSLYDLLKFQVKTVCWPSTRFDKGPPQCLQMGLALGPSNRPCHPRLCNEAHEGLPWGFQHPTSDGKVAIPSSSLLVATHDYYRCRQGSTSRKSPWGSTEYPGEVILITQVSARPIYAPSGQAYILRRPLSRSWLVLESPECSESSRASWPRSPVTWLQKPWGSSMVASRAKPTLGPNPARPPLGFRRH